MAIVGYCIIDINGDSYELVSSGSIRTEKNQPDGRRLAEIRADVISLIEKFSPDVASIEQLFFFKNLINWINKIFLEK